MTNASTGPENSLNPHHIAIIGGRKSGKTTLCASLHQSLIAASHGFSPNMITRFPDVTGLNQLENLFALKFSTNPHLFRAETTAPVRKIKIGIDFSSSNWAPFKRKRHVLSGYFNLEIDDLRDDFDLLGLIAAQPDQSPHLASASEGSVSIPDPIAHLTKSLTKAQSLIICHPAGQKLAPSESTGFIHLMSNIATGRYGSFETIIVAFTKYEQLFLKDGIKAFQKATNPDTILKVLKQTLKSDINLERGLSGLNSDEAGSPNLYALPVSSFGFLRHNGAANFDKLSNAPLSALTPQYELAREENPLKDNLAKARIAGFTVPAKAQSQKHETSENNTPHPSKHWLPFLTADPFLTAISGMPSKFTIPFGAFLSALDHDVPFEDLRRSA